MVFECLKMSKPNRETPRIVFVFGLWIYLALVSSISLCAWRAFRPPTALSPESSSAPIIEALIFLLIGALVLFLWHIYRAIGLTSFEVNAYPHFSFPWRITSCMATLSALVCIFAVQSARKQAPIESNVVIRSEPHMFSKINLLPPSSFWERLTEDYQVNRSRGLLLARDVRSSLQERTKITRTDEGTIKVVFRSEAGEDGVKILGNIVQALVAEFEAEVETLRDEAIQLAQVARSQQAQRVRELHTELLDLEPTLALSKTLPSNRVAQVSESYSPISETNGTLLDSNIQLKQLELANAMEFYSELDKEVSRLTLLPSRNYQVSFSVEEVFTAQIFAPYSLIIYGAAAFASLFLLVYCFWCLARISQQQHHNPNISTNAPAGAGA